MRGVKKFISRGLAGRSACIDNQPSPDRQSQRHPQRHRDDPGPSHQHSQLPENLPKKQEKMANKCAKNKCGAVIPNDYERIQSLLVKVKELKKKLTINDQGYIDPSGKLADTSDPLIALDHCATQLMRLREFFGNKWRIDEAKRPPCCEIVVPHVHTFVDGLAAIVQFSEGPPVKKDQVPTTSGAPEVLEPLQETSADQDPPVDGEKSALRVVPKTVTTSQPLRSTRSNHHNHHVEFESDFVSENAPIIRKNRLN